MNSRMNPYESPRSVDESRRPVSREGLTVCGSFVVLAVLGCAFVFRYWWSAGAPTVGIARCLVFAGIMAGVHLVGFRLWKRQEEDATKKANDSDEAVSIWSRSVPRGLFWVVVFTLLLLLLFALRL